MPPSFPISSASALKVLRQLANESAIIAAGGTCGVAATNYESHRCNRISKSFVEQKRKLHACSRQHGSAGRVARTTTDAAEAAPLSSLFYDINSSSKEENNEVSKQVPQEGIETKGNAESERGDFERLGEWRPLLDEARGRLQTENFSRSPKGINGSRSLLRRLDKRQGLSKGDIEVDTEARRYQRRIWKASGAKRPPEVLLPHYLIPKRFRHLRGPVRGTVEILRPEPAKECHSICHTMPKRMEWLPQSINPDRLRFLEGLVGEAAERLRPRSLRESPSSRLITLTRLQPVPHCIVSEGFRLFRKVVEPSGESHLDRDVESTIVENSSDQISSTNSETRHDNSLSPTMEYFKYVVSQAQRSTAHLDDYVIIDRLHASDYSGALHEYLKRKELSCASGSTPKNMLHALFTAALLANSRGTAWLIFEELEKNAHARPVEFNLLLSSYYLAGHEEMMGRLYVNYSSRFSVPWGLYSPLMAALLNTKRLATAESLMENTLDGRGKVKLGILQDLCASFLSKLWVNYRNLPLVESWFDKLCARDGHNLVTFKLYNSIIQACVESHEDTKAHHYYDQMISAQILSPDVRTELLMLELDASRGNWDAVKKGLQKLGKRGLKMAGAETFTRSFNRLFSTYTLHNNAKSAWGFIEDGIQKYGLVPDQILSNNLLSTCARDGNLDLVDKWFGLVSKKRWDIEFNKKTFALMFEWYWRGTKVSYEHLCVLIHACGHRILSHDLFDTVREATMSEHRRSSEGWTENRAHSQEKGPSNYVLRELGRTESQVSDPSLMIWKDWRRDPDQLRKKMLYTMSRGDMRQVLEYYREARTAGGLIKRIHLQLAVQASIKETGATEQASTLIRDATHVHGSQTVIGEVLAHNLKSWEPWEGIVELKDALESYYTLLEHHRLKIDERMIVVAANQILKFELAATAIDLLMWMHESRWCKQAPLGIAPMTILLRAYIMNRNLRGIEWVISHVLDTDIPIDWEFYYQVWTARRQLLWKRMTKSQIEGEEPLTLELHTWSAAIDIWIRDVLLRQRQAADEKLQRGFELVKLAKRYGGLGPLHSRAIGTKLDHPLRAIPVEGTETEYLASGQTSKTSTDEVERENRETWLRSTGWTPSSIPIHYMPRSIDPRTPRTNLQDPPEAMRKHIWALKTHEMQGETAERRAISELRATNLAGKQLLAKKLPDL